jgi:hypothetical protein
MSISELSVSRAAGRPSDDALTSASDVRARGAVTERLIANFPSVAPDRIGTLVAEAYARTGGARIQAFRVLLAERDVRAELHAGLDAEHA